MGYSVLDIVDKAIKVDNELIKVVDEVVEEKKDNVNLILMSKVLDKQLEKNIDYYKKLQDKIKDTKLEDIDFMVYDKISFLVNEFDPKRYKSNINSGKEYVEFLLDLEKEKYALFLNIQGRLVNSEFGYNKTTYEVLLDIISSTGKQIESLEQTLQL